MLIKNTVRLLTFAVFFPAAGWAQTLDVGWLLFSDEEVEQAVRSGPADMAENHDHYIHGTPKGIDRR